MRGSFLFSIATLIAVQILAPASAQDNASRRGLARITLASAQPAVTEPAIVPLIFSAPPRENAEESRQIYGPVARYLAQALGRPVVYEYPGTWGVYRTRMVKGEYDIAFDGPHFNSYRADQLGHEILARLPGHTQFAVIARNDLVFKGVERMGGRTFCAFAPPNLGTLVLLNLFENPIRQPVIVSRDHWQDIYDGVVSGRCDAGVLPLTLWKKFNRHDLTKQIFVSDELPGQAFSAGPRLSPGERRRLAAALLDPEGLAATASLRKVWKINELRRVEPSDYTGLSSYLKREWGFY